MTTTVILERRTLQTSGILERINGVSVDYPWRVTISRRYGSEAAARAAFEAATAPPVTMTRKKRGRPPKKREFVPLLEDSQ